MLSKSQIKLIHSLELKKYRQETGLFLVEGTKAVAEFISARWEPYLIMATEAWAKANLPAGTKNLQLAAYDEIQKASLQKTPQEVIAVFKQKHHKENSVNIKTGLGIALDEVQNAGNVGTIIRIALWFGFDYMIFGNGTADVFSPKVIQASMGSVAKMPFLQVSLTGFLQDLPKSTPVYGTFLEGTSIYKTSLKPHGMLIMGNEGNGISKNVEPFITQKLFIPPFPEGSLPIDSLNVSTATAIIAAEFRRKRI